MENGKLHPTLPKFPNLTGNKKDTQEQKGQKVQGRAESAESAERKKYLLILN